MSGKLSWKELKEKAKTLGIICQIGQDYIIINEWLKFKKDGLILIDLGNGNWFEAQYVSSYNKMWLIMRGLEE